MEALGPHPAWVRTVSSPSRSPEPDRVSSAPAPSAGLVALDTDPRAWHDGLLDAVMRAVIEAVLEAELAEHLKALDGQMATRRSGGNCRNGARVKSVRTVAGYVTIRSPRDRWGTFQPVTVGKWQRRVVGVDRLVLPLAAAGSSLDDTFGLVGHAYGSLVSRRTLLAMAASVRARLDPWHQRRMPTSVHALLLGRAVVRSRNGDLVARPVHTAVGVTADGSRELLGLWMRPPDGATDLLVGVPAPDAHARPGRCGRDPVRRAGRLRPAFRRPGRDLAGRVRAGTTRPDPGACAPRPPRPQLGTPPSGGGPARRSSIHRPTRARERNPSLSSTRCTCPSAVRREITSLSAICWFVSP